jgi:hypothetical protein
MIVKVALILLRVAPSECELTRALILAERHEESEFVGLKEIIVDQAIEKGCTQLVSCRCH